MTHRRATGNEWLNGTPDSESQEDYGVGASLPMSVHEVNAIAQQEQRKLDEVNAVKKDLKKKQDRRARVRQWIFFWANLILPKHFMELSTEDGRYTYEKYWITFYYDYFWKWLARISLTLFVFVVVWYTYPLCIDTYRDYKLRQPPPTTSYFDGRNIFIENVRIPHLLDPENFMDAAELDWIRCTVPIHLTSEKQLFRPIEYTWRDDRKYNITIEDLRRAVPQDTGKTCFCAAHFGVPLDVVFYGKEMWIQPMMSGSPGFNSAHKINITDSLDPDSITFNISPPQGIVFMLPEGKGLKMESMSERACVARCNVFVHKKIKYEEE